MEMPRHKIAFAAISFILGMLILYFLGSALQDALGMVGLMLTEFLILGIALISTLASRLSLKEVFCIKRSLSKEWLASFFIYLSAFFGAAAVSYLLSYLSPSLAQRSTQLNSFMMSGGFALALLCVALLPAICEEAWHRGYLLTSLGSIKGVASRVVIMGLLFGIFHLDQTRFFQTMILGMALSFMRIKTNNFLIPVVFHGINNLLSLSMMFALSQLTQALGPEASGAAMDASQAALPLTLLIPLVCFTLAFSLGFLLLGRHQFKRAAVLRESLCGK